jgi:hypothetical protein
MHLASFIPPGFFRWCQHTWIGRFEAESLWAFAIIETVHILGLTVLLGTLLVVDLRLLGIAMRKQSVPELSRELAPLTLGALVVMICTGVPLFLYEAVRLSTSSPFFFKMIFLSLAIIVHFTIHRKATATSIHTGDQFGKMSACLSLICWLGVALAGRGIAFIP